MKNVTFQNNFILNNYVNKIVLLKFINYNERLFV